MPFNLDVAEIIGPPSIFTSKDSIRVDKQWGTEFILPSNGYTTKIMVVQPGFKSSLHFHQFKNETFVLVQGSLDVEFYAPDSTRTQKLLATPLSCLILPACTPHSFSVPGDQQIPSIFIESSTQDSSTDNYRLTKSGRNV